MGSLGISIRGDRNRDSGIGRSLRNSLNLGGRVPSFIEASGVRLDVNSNATADDYIRAVRTLANKANIADRNASAAYDKAQRQAIQRGMTAAMAAKAGRLAREKVIADFLKKGATRSGGILSARTIV